MNRKGPKQRKADKRWDYVYAVGSSEGPIGYCQGWERAVYAREKAKENHAPYRPEEIDLQEKLQDKYHEDGHDTAEEACACYKEFLLDQKVNKTTFEHAAPCQVCEELTKCGIRLGVGGVHLYSLCEKHQDRASLEDIVVVGTTVGTL